MCGVAVGVATDEPLASLSDAGSLAGDELLGGCSICSWGGGEVGEASVDIFFPTGSLISATVMHVRNGAAKTDPGLAGGTNSSGRRRPGEGDKHFFFFAETLLIIYLDVKKSSRILFFGVGCGFFISVPTYSGSILSHQKPAAAKQGINSQPSTQSRGGAREVVNRTERKEELANTNQQRRPLSSSKNCFVCALQE